MATQPPRRVLEPLVAPKHYVPPSLRELRAQAVQRLQSGLFGMAAIVLVVGLANIINDRARQADAAARPQVAGAPISDAAQGSDPLADIGVVPSSQPEVTARTKARATGAAQVTGSQH
jgi:hypothetical protein